MKIAVLSDIHGNDVALEAVLADARALGVAHLLILGDLVGYYYNPDKVLQLLQDWPCDMISGNHEQMMKRALVDTEYLQKVTDKYGSGVKIALQKLSQQQIDLLVQLPEYRQLMFDQLNIGMYHGSPRDADEYIYPDSERSRLEQICDQQHDFQLMGHTHYPLFVQVGKTTLLNPGSVGQPRDIGGLASWALIDTQNRVVVHRRVKFALDDLLRACHQYDPQVEYLRNILTRDISR